MQAEVCNSVIPLEKNKLLLNSGVCIVSDVGRRQVETENSHARKKSLLNVQ